MLTATRPLCVCEIIWWRRPALPGEKRRGARAASLRTSEATEDHYAGESLMGLVGQEMKGSPQKLFATESVSGPGEPRKLTVPPEGSLTQSAANGDRDEPANTDEGPELFDGGGGDIPPARATQLAKQSIDGAAAAMGVGDAADDEGASSA